MTRTDMTFIQKLLAGAMALGVLAGCAAHGRHVQSWPSDSRPSDSKPAQTPGSTMGVIAPVTLSTVGPGWANNSVNTVVFRKNSLVTHGNSQYIAYYDAAARLVLGKRQLGTSTWTTQPTQFGGNASDAHNAISIMVDGAGYLHLAWDHHNDPLRYARSIVPGGLELTEKMAMLGGDEQSVSYPEFHRLPDGNLLFFYRNGASGNGNLVINRYDVATRTWTRLHSNLINGEGQRNAYWQAFVDHLGTVHLSWVWRESPDVSSNHDMAYARSRDGGRTWEKSDGEHYQLPITAANVEYAAKIPQNSELINQTSMSADKAGNPFIASYWREAGSSIPQYRVLYRTASRWERLDLPFRTTPFSLAGTGTKAIPISRPQILINIDRQLPSGLVIFRDADRANKVSVVTVDDFDARRWSVRDLAETSVGAWEPSYDTELWRTNGELNLFVQDVRQVDAEGMANVPATLVKVLQWRPFR